MIRSRRSLLPFYLSYAVGLVAPLVLGVVLFIRTSTLAEREIETRVQFAVEQAATDIESIYGDVEFIVTQASLSDPITDLSEQSFPETTEKYRQLIELVFNPAFVDTTAFSRFITNFYLILPVPEVVLSSTGIHSLASFYDYEFSIEGTDYDTFETTYLEGSFDYDLQRVRASSGLGTRTEEAVVLLHSLGPERPRRNLLLFVIDRRAIEDELRAASFEEGSAIFVLGRDDGIVADFVHPGTSFEVEVPADRINANLADWRFPENTARYAVTSPEGSVRIDARVPRAVFSARAAFVRRTTLILVIVVIAIDIVLVLVFSRRNARPLSEILSSLQSDLETRPRPPAEPRATHGPSLRFVERQLNRILAQKNDLQEELDDQRPILQSLILQSLVQGIRINDEELRGLFARSGIPLNTGFRCSVVMSFDPDAERNATDIYDEFALRKLYLEELCQRQISGGLSFLYQSHDRLVVIHGDDADSKESYHSRLVRGVERTVKELRRDAGVDVLVGIGNPYYSLAKIRTSFEEAVISVEQYAPLATDGFAVYGEFVDSHQSYHFPIELELRLLNATRQGSGEAVEKCVREIRRLNFHERTLSRESILILFGEIRGAIAKLNASIETALGTADEAATDLTQKSHGPEDWESFLDETETVLQRLAEFFRQKTRSSRSGIDSASITQYIADHFTDPNLSLTMMADAFGVSEKYFSRVFKERLNINFHLYLENTRLNFVRDRLKGTELPLREIVSASGYASPVTCSRAFKKRFGVNPSHYRESQRGS